MTATVATADLREPLSCDSWVACGPVLQEMVRGHVCRWRTVSCRLLSTPLLTPHQPQTEVWFDCADRRAKGQKEEALGWLSVANPRVFLP